MNNKNYLTLFNTFNAYMKVYNFSYNDGVKRYIINDDRIAINVDDNSYNLKAEFLSLLFNIYDELRIDVNIIINDDKLCDYLDYLNIDYELGEKLEIIVDGETIGVLTFDDNLEYFVNTKDVVSKIKTISNTILEVGVRFDSYEEELKGMCILQDLRLSGIICDRITNENVNIEIIVNEDDLIKGIIKVKDNTLGTTCDVAEDELIEYVNGVI